MKRSLVVITLISILISGCGSGQGKTTATPPTQKQTAGQQNTWPPAEQVHPIGGGFDGEMSKIILIEAKSSDTVTDKFGKIYKASPGKQFYIYKLAITNKREQPVHYVFPAFYTVKGEKFGETIYLDNGGALDQEIPPNGEVSQTIAAESAKGVWPLLQVSDYWDTQNHYFTGKAGN